METISEIISSLRAIGLTQDQVGAALGMTQVHVSNIEKGKRGSRTPAETLERAKKARDDLLAKHQS